MNTMTQAMGGRSNRGFTLIEIMIAVIIIGILTAIAYPSYLDHVRRGHQAEVQSQIMELAAALEAHRAKNFTYAGASISSLAPALSKNEHYSASLSPANPTQSYTITATPKSSLMSGMPTLTLDNTGVASWD